MPNNSPIQTSGNPPAPTPPETRQVRGKTWLLVAFLLVILILAAAIVSEMLYLLKRPEEKCKLFGCQVAEVITSTLPAPQTLSPLKVEWMKKFLDRLGSDRKDVQVFSEAKFTSVSQGVVVENIPEVIEEGGVRYIYFLVIQDQSQNTLSFRFTQDELDKMDTSIVGFNGESYKATVNDLTVGDSIVLKIINDFLYYAPGDKIILEISRENP